METGAGLELRCLGRLISTDTDLSRTTGALPGRSRYLLLFCLTPICRIMAIEPNNWNEPVQQKNSNGIGTSMSKPVKSEVRPRRIRLCRTGFCGSPKHLFGIPHTKNASFLQTERGSQTEREKQKEGQATFLLAVISPMDAICPYQTICSLAQVTAFLPGRHCRDKLVEKAFVEWRSWFIPESTCPYMPGVRRVGPF